MRHYKELKEGLQDKNIFKAIFLAGGPGSGKSYVVGQSTTPFQGLKIINSDDEFNKVLKFETTHIRGGKNASPLFGKNPKAPETIEHPFAQKKRAEIAKPRTEKRQRALELGRLGMIIDSTGAKIEKVNQQIKSLQKLGYDCYLIFVDTTLEVSLARNKERARGGRDRQLPDNIVKKDWQNVQNNKMLLKRFVGSQNYIEVQNDNAGQNVFKKLGQHIKMFLARKVQNEIGRAWISSEMEKRQIKKYVPPKPDKVSSAPGAHRHIRLGGEPSGGLPPVGTSRVYQTKGRYVTKHKKLMQKLR